MKRLLLILPLLALMFIACNRDNDDENSKVQLLKSITTYHDGIWSVNFEYDDKDRITTIFSDEIDVRVIFTYNGDDLVKVMGYVGTMDFSKNGNKITVLWNEEVIVIELNSDEYPIKASWENGVGGFHYFNKNGTSIYQYLDDNVSSVSFDGEQSVMGSNVKSITQKYKYDNKKSPFYNCKTPKWFPIHFCISSWWWHGFYGVKNNVTEFTYTSIEEDTGDIPTSTYTYTYEYDNNGFATKMFEKGVLTATFTYY